MLKKGNVEDKAQIDVTIRWFSVLAEHRGTRSEQITAPHGWTGRDLLDHLACDFPELDKYRHNVRLAINHEFVSEDSELQDGDEVAFLTPVSGG